MDRRCVPAWVFISAFGLVLLPANAEVPPEKSISCFPGAYYRKAVSSQDRWSGIEGVITLPQFTPDPARLNPDTGRPLDNPSIYVGGRAENQEIDCGLSWEVIKQADGKVSQTAKAFRPFWRNKDWHSGPAKPDFYYYPGDQLRIRLESTTANQLHMTIELLSRGEIGRDKTADFFISKDTSTSAALAGNEIPKPKAADASTTATDISTTAPNGKPVIASGNLPKPGSLKSNGIPFAATAPDAITSLSVTFDALNFGPDRIQEFKRVNAIDQSGNEGKDASPTKARVTDATWTDVYLLRGKMRVPFSAMRYTDMRCPNPKHFTVFNFGNGNERISIRGAAK